MDLATLLAGGAQSVVRDPVTAVVTRSDETGVWVSTEGSDPTHPIGPCRGFNEDGVDVGTNVLLVWTPDGPWAVGGSPSGGFVTVDQLNEAIADLEPALPPGGTAVEFLDGTKNWAVPPGDFFHEQTFVTASTTWTVAHNRGNKGVSVRTFNEDGGEIIGDRTDPDDNTLQIHFAYARTGMARVFD